jgi:septal ring factor EnvC (AmiA/AmiB activator)
VSGSRLRLRDFSISELPRYVAGKHIDICARSQFEEEQLAARQGRLEVLRTSIDAEEQTLAENQQKKANTDEEIQRAEASLEELRGDLRAFNDSQEDKNSAVDKAKRVAAKTTKALDQAVKDIGTLVCDPQSSCLNSMLIARGRRTTRSRSSHQTARVSIANVAWRTSLSLSCRAISGMCRWMSVVTSPKMGADAHL